MRNANGALCIKGELKCKNGGTVKGGEFKLSSVFALFALPFVSFENVIGMRRRRERDAIVL